MLSDIMHNMSGDEGEFELTASNTEHTLCLDADVTDSQHTMENVELLSESDVPEVGSTTKDEKAWVEILTSLNDDTTDNNEQCKAGRDAIDAMKYEDLREIYSPFIDDQFYRLFKDNGTFLHTMKRWGTNVHKNLPCTCICSCIFSCFSCLFNIGKKQTHPRNDDQTISIAGKVINWVTNHQFPYLYEKEKDTTSYPQIFPRRDLFLWAVMTNKLDLARALWRKILERGYIVSALTASLMLKSMAKKIIICDDPSVSELYRNFLSEAKWYENQAKEILQECSRTDFTRAVVLFLSPSEDWGNKSPCTLALSGRHVTFLDQECSRYALQITWNSPIKQLEQKYSKILETVREKDSPNFNDSNVETEKQEQNRFESIDVQENESTNLEKVQQKRIESTEDSDNANEKSGKCSKKMELCIIICVPIAVIILLIILPFILIWLVYRWLIYMYNYKVHSPRFKFMLNLLSYLSFMALFSYFLLFDLRPGKLGTPEILVWCWIFSMWLEELRQIIHSAGSNPWLKLVDYLANPWNIYDQVGFSLFFAAIIMRLIIGESQFYWVTMVYVVCLIIFILRLLQYFAVSEFLGPKIGILMRMFQDTIAYIFMFGLFLIAYGIAAQVLHYPNSNPTNHVPFNIFFYPYYTLFGQFDLLQDRVFSCTHNDTLVSMDDGISKCSWLADILFAAYAFVVCIMLINLLIATYSATFEKVEQNAKELWLSYRIDIITEYIRKPILPPPLNVLEYIYSIMKAMIYKIGKKSYKSHNLELKFKQKEIYQKLMELEKQSFENVLKKQEENISMNDGFQDDLKKLKADMQHILLHLQSIKCLPDQVE